jgi:hypothetical protein
VHEVLSGEQRLAAQQLGEDASDAPQVDRLAVAAVRIQDQLRRAVPSRHHQLRHAGLRRRARQPEIGDLEVARRVDQQVARLQVPVQHAARVDELDPLEDLVREVLDVQAGQRLLALDHLVQVGGHELHHQVDLVLGLALV